MESFVVVEGFVVAEGGLVVADEEGLVVVEGSVLPLVVAVAVASFASPELVVAAGVGVGGSMAVWS